MKAAKTQPKYTKEQLEQIALKLREMPEPSKTQQELSKQEAVKILAKDIASLQKRGYSIEQIAESLSGAGLDISTPTLRNYLTRAKGEKKTPRKKAAQEPVTRVTDPAKATFTPTPDSDEI